MRADSMVDQTERNRTPLIVSQLPFTVRESPTTIGAKRRESAATWTALLTSSGATPGAVRLVDGQSRSPVPSAAAWAVSVSVRLPLLLKSSASTKVRGTVLGMQIG